MIVQHPSQCRPLEVVDLVADYFGFTRAHVLSAARHHSIVTPRHIAMYLLHEFGGLTLTETALALNRNDHTTTLSALRSVRRAIATDPETRQRVDWLEKLVRARGLIGDVSKFEVENLQGLA